MRLLRPSLSRRWLLTASTACVALSLITVANAADPIHKASRIGTHGAGQAVHAVAYQNPADPSQITAIPADDTVVLPSDRQIVIQAVSCETPCDAGSGCDTCAAASCDACSTGGACDDCGNSAGAGACGNCCSDCGGCEGNCNAGCLTGCDCDLGDAWTLSSCLHGDCPPAISVGGWFSFGYHSESNDLFNDRPDELSLHQGWLVLEKVADADDSPLGFRVDFMYGIDGTDTQAFGNDSGNWDYENGFDHGAYSWAIPQLYAELALGDWNIKAGHFYTLIGYEVVTAPDNFFYSHAITMYNSEPFTHTGVIASRPISDDVEIFAGWTLGWDTGFDQLGNGSSWLGGVSLALSEDAGLTYISTAGDFGWRGEDAYSHSVVLDMTMTDNLNWVVQSDLVRVDSTGEDNVGLNQYFLYTVNDCLGLGARLEWWKGDVLTDYAPHGATLPASGSLSYYAATFGMNYRPSANVMVRPEYRFDWSPAADYDESYFGVDAIVTF